MTEIDLQGGYEIAERLSLDAYHKEQGDDGAVYFLEDGRMLKITGSAIEAAVCQQLLEASAFHPNVPRIDMVFRFQSDLVIEGERFADGVTRSWKLPRYAIVRESFDDPFEQPSGDGLGRLKTAWGMGDRSALQAIAQADDLAAQVLSGLVHIERTTSMRLQDVRMANIGESRAGCFGLRDFSRGDGPSAVVVAACERIQELPQPGAELRP